MTNYTAERHLEEAYSIIAEKQSSEHEDVDPVLITCMKAYAFQEVKKHLEIANEKAHIVEKSDAGLFGYKTNIRNGITTSIAKHTITDIEINLT